VFFILVVEEDVELIGQALESEERSGDEKANKEGLF